MPQEKAARPRITTPVPRWRQVADYLRDGILSGQFPAGQPLPSEETLAGEFGVSRPVIRQAVATLTGEGLVSVRRPFGAIVRDPHARPAHTQDRSLTADYTEPDASEWTMIGKPVYLRIDATAAHADLLQGIYIGTPMLTREALQAHGDKRRSVWLAMPFPVAAELDAPWQKRSHLPEPAEVYRWLAEQGHSLTFQDHIRARMPFGDETASLSAKPGIPLLVVSRVCTVAGRPVTLEETRVPADQSEFLYPVAGDPSSS
ncbi:GntR family transcriptional regulator [Cryptosporangium aurantiacum]|uniref:GntR family transcriptional regulator n=1 Tax=Cryptosporangium aurantiacum TaxID=134849 RepID=A0A1M7Q2I1_9ACTN|nr:GntR family transcriptional regulator [Cryptosporangium aurantiacum]SHN24379.1 GntR family transcriptional regulator [Cryptosporangium aurantiacum]